MTIFFSSQIIHVIEFSNLVDLWVITMKEPRILCLCSMWRSSDKSPNCRSSSENIWKFCLFYSHNNKITWLSNITDTFWGNLQGTQRVCGLFFLDCAFRMLTGWAGKLQSRIRVHWFTTILTVEETSVRTYVLLECLFYMWWVWVTLVL